MEKDNITMERTTVSQNDDYERYINATKNFSDELLRASVAVSNLQASQFNEHRNNISKLMSDASKTMNMMLKSFEEEYAMVDKLMEDRYQLETYLKEHGIIKNENTQEAENESDIER